jgi:hypothetical protein
LLLAGWLVRKFGRSAASPDDTPPER